MQTYSIETADRFAPDTRPLRAVQTIRFGRFLVLPASRRLIRNEKDVAIGARAFDLLVALLHKRGELLDKIEIRKSVWPSIHVDESNIRFQIAALRRVLGPEAQLIKTIAGRGYLLADSDAHPEPRLPTPPMQAPVTRGMLPDWLRWDRLTGETAEIEPYVVLIDDDSSVLEALAGLVRCAGFRVEAFQSPRAFLESYQPYPPSCIVLDAWLPGQGGLDFQDRLVSGGSNVPIIFISGHADIAMTVRAIKAGAFDFLAKPVRHQELLAAIGLAVAAAVA